MWLLDRGGGEAMQLTELKGRLQGYEWSPDSKRLALVIGDPDPEADGISAFTREDLVRICEARFGKTCHPASMGRLLRRLGFSRQKARPSHPQKDPALQEAFKKSPGAFEKPSVYAQRQAHPPVLPG